MSYQKAYQRTSLQGETREILTTYAESSNKVKDTKLVRRFKTARFKVKLSIGTRDLMRRVTCCICGAKGDIAKNCRQPRRERRKPESSYFVYPVLFENAVDSKFESEIEDSWQEWEGAGAWLDSESLTYDIIAGPSKSAGTLLDSASLTYDFVAGGETVLYRCSWRW